MPAIWPPERPFAARSLGLGRPAAVAEGLLELVLLVDVGLVLVEFGFVLVGETLPEGPVVGEVRVDEAEGDGDVEVGAAVGEVVGVDAVLSGGAVEGAV